MKKFLIYLKYNFATGLALLHSVAAIPIQLNAIEMNDLDNLSSSLAEIDEDDTNDELESKDDVDEDETEDSLYDFNSDLIIYALNPGYTEYNENNDKFTNVGEFIELANLTDAELELAGYSLYYTNTSGKRVEVFTFPEGSYMSGKHLLLRFSRAQDQYPADANYTVDLAMSAGPLELYYEDELVDVVCWNGKEKCLSKFTSDKKTSLERNLVTGEFEHTDYFPEYDESIPNLFLPEPAESDEPLDSDELENLEPKCRGLEFSELLTYYTEGQDEQFIEFYNSSSTEIDLTYCKINYKNKLYELGGIIQPGKYLAYYPSGQFSLTKNPKNPLTLTLIDADKEVLDEMAYPNGQKKSTSYARTFTDGAEDWQITYAITPNAENIYQKYRSCEEGKVINEATGNCVKAPSVKSSASSTSISSKILEPCPEGKYRNPLTGRCKNIETTSTTLKPCAEGYERNPETNRCRKVASTSGGNDGADYALVPKTRSDSTVFIGVGIVSIIVLIGGTYVVLQFRHEIARAGRKIRQRCNHIRQDLLARGIGRDRNKKS